MDDKVNPLEEKSRSEPQEPQPIFETVPEDVVNKNEAENIKPEEIPPEVASPVAEDVSKTGGVPPSDIPPVMYEDNKKKYLIVIGGIVFFFVLFAVFFRIFFGGRGAAKAANLIYWGLWEDKEIIQPLIDDYQRKTPHVKIDFQKMSPQEYREKLLARSKNGQGPDVFRFHNTWLPEIQDVVSPLPQNIMSNSEFEKTFYSIHQKDLKIKNRYYGLPLEIDGLLLIYNNDLFKKIGIPSAPTTWDELTDIVNKFSESRDKDGNPLTPGIALGTAKNVEHFSDILGLMIMQNGGDITKLDRPEAVEALESYRKFAEPPNQVWTEDLPNSVVAFSQEKVAMIFAPSWQIVVIKSINPDIDLRASPVPIVPGASPVSIANYWVEGVSRYSKNQIEAWKFLRFLIEKENMTKLYELESKVRLFGEPYSRVDLRQIIAQNEYIGPVVKQADNFVSLPLISRTYDNGLNDEIVAYLENAVNATIQGVSYGEAFATAKRGVDQVLEKYKIQ